ncbi:hypothetical protein TSAR_012540 [Trichomalopsis sarcophagae]|uniref:Uncharacterized protein n=1 Tax=Trichomalopsis sarcophagae TaxID=543379 RepID=A0A232EES5_9HYME|nr:hypothetical protein TSAR_012540 [Trichomalopsis sarcophagae]
MSSFFTFYLDSVYLDGFRLTSVGASVVVSWTPSGPGGSWRLRLSHADVAGCSGPLDDGGGLAGFLPLVGMVAGSSGRWHFRVPTRCTCNTLAHSRTLLGDSPNLL